MAKNHYFWTLRRTQATYGAAKAALADPLAGPLAVPLATVAASAAYVTAAAPFDVVKAMMMVAPDDARPTVASCARDLARAGPAAFFRGWPPALVRLLPIAMVVFPLMEALRGFLGAAAF